jgi:hypothetical protein
MSRGNIILLVVLAGAVGVWLMGRDSEKGKPAGPAPKLFPAFNREAADRIEITGGSGGTSWELLRQGSEWFVGEPGGYPVKRAEIDRFLDAVSSLRKENAVGTSADMQAQMRTDDKEGRLVRVLKGDEPMAEFRVGKNPKRGYHEVFIRKADDNTVYRTQTLLAKERTPADNQFGGGVSGFDWHGYTGKLSSKWVEPTVWDLGGAEAQEIWITRTDQYEAKLVKQAEDKWDVIETGKDPAPADADVAQGILSTVRHLRFEDILGAYPAAAKEYGLEKPETTILLTLKKKVEKPAPKEGEGEGEKNEGEEKKEDEYVTFTRTVEVGKKVAVPEYDDYSGETRSVDYYAIHVGPEGDVDNSSYVFLVRDYTAGQLRKELTDLHAKPAEGEEKGPGEEEGEKPGDEEPAEPGTDDKPAEEQKPSDEKPTGGTEQPKDGEEKKDGCGAGKEDGGEKEGCGGEKDGCGENEDGGTGDG